MWGGGGELLLIKMTINVSPLLWWGVSAEWPRDRLVDGDGFFIGEKVDKEPSCQL